MALVRSLTSYNIRRFSLLTRCELGARTHTQLWIPKKSTFKHQFCFSVYRGMHSKISAQMDSNNPPPSPNPPKFSFPTWTRWILGTILSLFLPFLKKKWEKIRQIEGEVEKVVEAVETTAEVVEKVAEVVEKVSMDIADNLPDDGRLKSAALIVENASKEVAEDAQQTIDFIEKVDELKQEVETFIEPISHEEKEEEEEEGAGRK